MTNIHVKIEGSRLCFDMAYSRRDTIYNIVVLVPSLRTLHPSKHFENCIDIDGDMLAVKIYISNRGVRYVTIVDLRNRVVVADLRDPSDDSLRYIIKAVANDVSDEVVEHVIDMAR